MLYVRKSSDMGLDKISTKAVKEGTIAKPPLRSVRRSWNEQKTDKSRLDSLYSLDSLDSLG
jgi:hypothetical protein